MRIESQEIAGTFTPDAHELELPRRRRRWRIAADGAVAEVLWLLAALFLILALWQAVVWIGQPSELTLPSPSVVLSEIVESRSILAEHSLVTLREILIGFGLALVLGFPIAIAISFSEILRRLAYPLLVTSQAVPKVAIAPLLLIWVGFGPMTNALVALLIAIFPIIINTALGLSVIEPDLVRLGRAMGASKLRLFIRIRLPNALPTIFGGVKLGITFATIGAVVGEFVAGNAGLGYLAQQAAGTLNTVLTFACLVVLSLMAILLFYAVEIAESRMTRWYPSRQKTLG